MTIATDLSGLFKESYGDDVINLVPESSIVTKAVPFVQKAKQIGNKYHQPVIVRPEHGVTYAGPDAGAFNLNSAITMKMQDAQVPGYQMVLRATLDYESAYRAATGKPAFMDATQLQVENMLESLGKRAELGFLYGQSGIGTADTSSNVSATVTNVTYTTASWADGTWSGLEGAQVQFFNAANGNLVSSGADSIFTVVTVDTVNRVVQFSGTATGITALDSLLSSGNADTFFNGARTDATTFNETPGVNKIITNTGTLYNIDAATWSLWKGNSYGAGSAALTFGKLQNAVAIAVGRGLMEDVDILVNPKTWGNLLNEQTALRRYDGSFNTATTTNGSKAIEFYGQNGKMRIHSHPFVKEGEAFVLPLKRAKRIGASEITFTLDSKYGEGMIFRQLDGQAGFEYRLYSNQTMFIETPAKCVKVTGIVNS